VVCQPEVVPLPKPSPFARGLFRPHSVALLAVLLGGPVAAVAAPAGGDVLPGLVAHRAVYEMRLDRADDRADVVGVDGRLVYEFGGSVCEGFSSRFRLVTRLAVKDGTSRLTDLRTTSFEDAEGRGFDFLNQSFVDDRMVEEVTGNAERSAGRLAVKITRPSARAVELPPVAEFPTRHMASIIAAAEAGERVTEIEPIRPPIRRNRRRPRRCSPAGAGGRSRSPTSRPPTTPGPTPHRTIR
jgi:hypothetical protein